MLGPRKPMTRNVAKFARIFYDFLTTSHRKEIERDLLGNVREVREVDSKTDFTFSCPFLELCLIRRLRNLWMPLIIGKRIVWVNN